jgi:hypothetical protein
MASKEVPEKARCQSALKRMVTADAVIGGSCEIILMHEEAHMIDPAIEAAVGRE